MRSVKVTYETGKVVEYSTIKEASEKLYCNRQLIISIASGESEHSRRKMMIASIEMSENRGIKRTYRTKDWRPTRVTHRDGRVYEGRCIRDALRNAGLEGKNVSLSIGDGQWHLGGQWKFDFIEAPEFEFVRPVPPEIIELCHQKALFFAYKYARIPYEEKKDVVQYAVSKTASEWSAGRHDGHVSLDDWIWGRVKHWCGRATAKYHKYASHIAEPSSDELDNATWYEGFFGKEDMQDTLIDEMPDDLKPLARLYDAGYRKSEICHRLKMKPRERDRLTERLVSWLKERIDGDA